MACVKEKRNALRVFMVKPEGNRPLGRLRHRCEKEIRRIIFKKQDGRSWIGFI
jgi:hypothetical protein